MTTRKLTTIEKRAKNFCNDVRWYGSARLTVEWIRSATWGVNPRIMYGVDKLTNVSGCGFCKESTALADCLRFLGDDESAVNAIWSTGGCGPETVIRVLATYGWRLERIASGRNFDAYQIARIAAEAVAHA